MKFLFSKYQLKLILLLGVFLLSSTGHSNSRFTNPTHFLQLLKSSSHTNTIDLNNSFNGLLLIDRTFNTSSRAFDNNPNSLQLIKNFQKHETSQNSGPSIFKSNTDFQSSVHPTVLTKNNNSLEVVAFLEHTQLPNPHMGVTDAVDLSYIITKAFHKRNGVTLKSLTLAQERNSNLIYEAYLDIFSTAILSHFSKKNIADIKNSLDNHFYSLTKTVSTSDQNISAQKIVLSLSYIRKMFPAHDPEGFYLAVVELTNHIRLTQ